MNCHYCGSKIEKEYMRMISGYYLCSGECLRLFVKNRYHISDKLLSLQ